MKKKISALILCGILLASACSLAERAATEVVFDGFTVTIGKVTQTDDALYILFWADFDSQTEAASYHFSLKDGNMTEAELEAYYRNFLDKQWWRPTPDTQRKMRAIVASIKTLAGEAFPLEGFSYSEFGGSSAIKQPDGKWRSEVTFKAQGFSTEEEGVLFELYRFDAEEDAPFPSAPEQTVYVAFP